MGSNEEQPAGRRLRRPGRSRSPKNRKCGNGGRKLALTANHANDAKKNIMSNPTKALAPSVVAPMVHWIRHEKVILDFDLAKLYEIETRALKQAVRRNRERFPADFLFE